MLEILTLHLRSEAALDTQDHVQRTVLHDVVVFEGRSIIGELSTAENEADVGGVMALLGLERLLQVHDGACTLHVGDRDIVVQFVNDENLELSHDDFLIITPGIALF